MALAGLAGLAQAATTPTETALPAASATQVQNPPATSGLAAMAAQFDKSPGVIVADVNGTPITAGMVADRLREFPDKFGLLPTQVIYKSALDDLIQQRALAVKARELGLNKQPETVRRIDEATDRELGQALVRRILPELVTEKAIEDHYNATIAKQPGPDQVRFRVIATSSEEDGKIVLDVLNKGTDFAALAQKVSKDPSAFNGGEIGFSTRGQLTPEIGAVVFTLLPGQTTAFPIPSGKLWFVIKLEERRQLGTRTLAESRPLLTGELIRAASAEILSRTRAAVTVKDYGPNGMQGHDDSADTKSH
jgi:peptidyl-prolyl cis-trans isomerase C